MARKVDLGDRRRDREHVRLHAPDGSRFTIFGEGGGQELADELDVPLLGKVPLQPELRSCADEGQPLVLVDPDAPASQAIRQAARGLVAELPPRPILTAQPAESGITGTPLPMAH
jgi:ATP-binding protein involved in chromosome partitioning